MKNIGKCPSHCNREEWQTEEHIVEEGYHEDISDPHAFAVEVRRVGVGIAVCDSDIHCL